MTDEKRSPPLGGTSQPAAAAPPSGHGGDRRTVVVDEIVLLPIQGILGLWRFPSTPKLMGLQGLEPVKVLSTSRFGVVKLMQRRRDDGNVEHFAAKFYNVGDNCDGSRAFWDCVNPIIALSHPHVMPIVDVIEPTKVCGPIIITRYSEYGSLSDVLSQVNCQNPPSFWGYATKLRMIVSLVSG